MVICSLSKMYRWLLIMQNFPKYRLAAGSAVGNAEAVELDQGSLW